MLLFFLTFTTIVLELVHSLAGNGGVGWILPLDHPQTGCGDPGRRVSGPSGPDCGRTGTDAAGPLGWAVGERGTGKWTGRSGPLVRS